VSRSELSTLIMLEQVDAIMYFRAMVLFLLLGIFTSATGYAISFLTKVENFRSQVCQQPAAKDSQRDQQPVLVP